jgi:cytochrome c-type biogenesis protein CcmH/NrfF
MYYVAKVTLTETVDTNSGTKEKKSRYQYLVEALSVTEAEAKMAEDMKGTVTDWEITGVAKSQIVDVI